MFVDGTNEVGQRGNQDLVRSGSPKPDWNAKAFLRVSLPLSREVGHLSHILWVCKPDTRVSSSACFSGHTWANHTYLPAVQRLQALTQHQLLATGCELFED